jgi:uroporphyrinogen decarboxylase
MRALAFEETDRVPLDLGGMPSTGISCFAYPPLVEALGLPPRPPKVYDTGQMLALPDPDVLDALNCDVAALSMTLTNAFEQTAPWKPYPFNGRLDAMVENPALFDVEADGAIVQPSKGRRMPPQSHVFEEEHGGQPFSLLEDAPRPDLDALARQLEASAPTEAGIAAAVALAMEARAATDRAILYCGPGAGIGIANFGGLAAFPMLCMIDPGFVHQLHELVTDHAVRTLERLLPRVAPYIDIYLVAADDWGTQASLIASPSTYQELFQPYYRRVNDTLHRLAPEVKTFFHSCGAVYDLIDPFIESGFDVLNPVQWTAGPHGYAAWKDKCHGRIALWGGGVNAQQTLALGAVAEIEAEVRRVVPVLARGGGYVFNSIHNILAEIPADKVIALYRAAHSA